MLQASKHLPFLIKLLEHFQTRLSAADRSLGRKEKNTLFSLTQTVAQGWIEQL